MRFLADAMLGRLARRMRLMGLDTVYMRDTSDAEVLKVARAEGRMLLTRDAELAARPNPAGTLHLRANDTDGQLAEFMGRFGLLLEGTVSPPRCPRCNGELRLTASRAEVEGRVPEHVLHSYGRFFICSGCGNVYWEGTQHEAMREMLEKFRGRG